MAPIDVVILVLVIGSLAAIVWRAVIRTRRAKTAPASGCEGCAGCAAAKGGCAGCSYTQQPASKGGSCCH